MFLPALIGLSLFVAMAFFMEYSEFKIDGTYANFIDYLENKYRE